MCIKDKINEGGLKMDIKEFKNYTENLHLYDSHEVDEMEIMTDQELDEYQIELEKDSGNLSDWDHIRAVFSFKYKIMQLENK